MRHASPTRRLLLASLVLPPLQGCASPLPPLPAAGPAAADAQALLAASADAHGLSALAGIKDICVSYAGAWRPVVGRLQPDLVDAGFRGRSEERLLPWARLVGQAHTGPAGHKQVVREGAAHGPGEVRVWFNGAAALDRDRRHAAAMVADDYSLFLLGPMLLAGPWSGDRAPVMTLGGSERVRQDGRVYECDVLRVRVTPGAGFSQTDQLALFIDREERLMRRVRFTLDGLDSTKGAIAEVDLSDHVGRSGIRWPTRFYERLLRPVPLLPVHDWRLTGLDVNRGLTVDDIAGPAFSAKAAAPATPLAGAAA